MGTRLAPSCAKAYSFCGPTVPQPSPTSFNTSIHSTSQSNSATNPILLSPFLDTTVLTEQHTLRSTLYTKLTDNWTSTPPLLLSNMPANRALSTPKPLDTGVKNNQQRSTHNCDGYKNTIQRLCPLHNHHCLQQSHFIHRHKTPSATNGIHLPFVISTNHTHSPATLVLHTK